LWVPKTCANWADALRDVVGSVTRTVPGGQVLVQAARDDLQLVGLKLIFLVVSWAVSVLGLSRREAWWKDAEILMLRHQLAVALRERPGTHPRLTWPDRAWLALLAGTLPAGALGRVAADRDPGHDFALAPRHRPPPVDAVVPPGTFRSAAGAPHCAVGGAPAGARERVMGVPADPTVSLPARHHRGTVDGVADPQGRRDRPGSAQGRPWVGGAPAVPAQGILALDFFTADLLNGTKVYVLALIEHRNRPVRVLGATEHPVQSWVVQQARNLLHGPGRRRDTSEVRPA
jgi:putative transposase